MRMAEQSLPSNWFQSCPEVQQSPVNNKAELSIALKALRLPTKFPCQSCPVRSHHLSYISYSLLLLFPYLVPTSPSSYPQTWQAGHHFVSSFISTSPSSSNHLTGDSSDFHNLSHLGARTFLLTDCACNQLHAPTCRESRIPLLSRHHHTICLAFQSCHQVFGL